MAQHLCCRHDNSFRAAIAYVLFMRHYVQFMGYLFSHYFFFQQTRLLGNLSEQLAATKLWQKKSPTYLFLYGTGADHEWDMNSPDLFMEEKNSLSVYLLQTFWYICNAKKPEWKLDAHLVVLMSSSSKLGLLDMDIQVIDRYRYFSWKIYSLLYPKALPLNIRIT